MDCCIVFVTVPKDEAKGLQEQLVREKHAACISKTAVESCYFWKGKMEKEEEYLLIIKTKASLLDKLIARIEELHSYDTPEILALPILKGSSAYLKWMDETLSSG